MTAETTPAPKEVPQPASGDALLPCPFCGGKAHMQSEHDPDDIKWHFIKCPGCGARSGGQWHTKGNDCPIYYAQVREEWNTRAASGAPQEAPGDAPRNGVLVPSDKLAELQKEAARYRWLRAGGYPIEFARAVLNDTPHGIDAAVDAAMKGPQ